jgi:hypothetical protein
VKTLIAASLLLALASPAHAEWFLSFDMQLRNCATRSRCVDKRETTDWVTKETFATRNQCLAKGDRVIKLFKAPYSARAADTEGGHIIEEMGSLYGDAEGSGITQLHVRCEEGFEMSGTAAEWNCDNDITAAANRGRFFISMGKGKYYEGDTVPPRGSWDFRKNGDLWINGRQCKQTN